MKSSSLWAASLVPPKALEKKWFLTWRWDCATLVAILPLPHVACHSRKGPVSCHYKVNHAAGMMIKCMHASPAAGSRTFDIAFPGINAGTVHWIIAALMQICYKICAISTEASRFHNCFGKGQCYSCIGSITILGFNQSLKLRDTFIKTSLMYCLNPWVFQSIMSAK